MKIEIQWTTQEYILRIKLDKKKYTKQKMGIVVARDWICKGSHMAT